LYRWILPSEGPMTHIPKFRDALVALPSVIAIDALVDGGIEAMPSEVYRALRRDEVGEALEAAEDWYEGLGGELTGERRTAGIAYAFLLENCDLLDEALEFAREMRGEAGEDAELVLVEAEILLERGEVETADELLAGFHQAHGDGEAIDGSAWGFAADLLLDVGRDEEAIDCYETAVSRGTDTFETVIRLATLHQERENWSRAAECFELAADLGGEVAGPWAEAAESWRQAGELRKSLEARDRVLEQRTGDAETWARQGVGYRHVGEKDKAIEALKKATRLAPDRPAYWIELAHTLREIGHADEAIERYRKVLEFDDELVEAVNGLAEAALDQGDLALALEVTGQAVETAPDDGRSWFLSARALRRKRRIEEAEEAVRRALECDDDEARHHRLLGEIALEQNRPDEGFEALERAVELSPDDGAVVVPFAEALLRANHYDRLDDLLDREESWSASLDWRFVEPILRLIVDGITDERRDLEPVVERFEATVEGHTDALPMAYDFEELSRYALVLDDRRQWVIEQMIEVLEGREPLEELRVHE